MQISKTNQILSKCLFVLFLKLILGQNTISEDEHSVGEFYYPDKFESHEENSEATALSGYEQVYENSHKEVENFVKEWRHNQENFQWYENISALFILSKQGKRRCFGLTSL